MIWYDKTQESEWHVLQGDHDADIVLLAICFDESDAKVIVDAFVKDLESKAGVA